MIDMKIYILAQNEQGYLLARINGNYYLIDDYSGTIETQDVLQVIENFRGCGKHHCINRKGHRLWVSIAGDVGVPNEYFPDYTE